MALKLGVVADDLTGGCDTGVQFSRKGLKVVVLFSPEGAKETLRNSDILVLDTDSRAIPAEAAYRRTAETCLALKAGGIESLYKKLDSTLRGNVGAELEAAMDALHVRRAVVAPAFPLQGRTFQGGRLLIRGAVPEDPTLRETDLPSLLKAQMRRSIDHLPLDVVRSGPAFLKKKMGETWGEGKEVLALDAADQEDLKTIAATLIPLSLDQVVAGSAGLAMELAEVWGLGRVTEDHPRLQSERVLVIAGSPNPVTASQVGFLSRVPGVKILGLRLSRLFHDEADETTRVAKEAALSISRGYDLVVRPEGLASQEAVDVATIIARALGRVTKAVVEADPTVGLTLTGGETARAACFALGASGIELVTEVLPGIPAGWLRGGPFEGLLLVTKAGGFGGEDALAYCLRVVKEGL
ncbi:MAG: four-carbon acid sugar kinase family protein [candidate division NC10 bacterium]|nr:four-carbon acid sugar kinase family protein [candidate division NC10 bacterium]